MNEIASAAGRAGGKTGGALLVALVLVACSGTGDRESPREHGVEIRNFEYEPSPAVLSRGEMVVWVNRDLVPHTVTAIDGSWDSGPIAPGASWQ